MERLRVRFEERRGHWMIVEGEPALTRDDVEPFPLRMLQRCEVPGLLRVEPEEIDGVLSLRYPLNGTRMLAQSLRAHRWTMTELMTALCRLAEVLEECRLYVLDERKVVLQDDWIFVGEGWDDLRLICLPVREERVAQAGDLGALIVRWIMHVKDPDGQTVQQLLKLAASPDFKPGGLRGFARQYLAAKVKGGDEAKASRPTERDDGEASETPPPVAPSSAASPSPSAGWRWFQPPPGEAQALSGLLGMEVGIGPAWEPESLPERGTDRDSGRRIVWISCSVAGIAAVAWRWGYAAHPGTIGLLASAGVTLLAVAGAVIVEIWMRRRNIEPEHSQTDKDGGGMRSGPGERPMEDAGERPDIPQREWHPLADPDPERAAPIRQTATPGRSDDRTVLLAPERAGSSPAGYYLLWESKKDFPPLPLNTPSFVIGRSREASAHVDDSSGVSRAHLELLRDGPGWTAKDLGSRNGTKLNGAPMVPYESYPLQPEDCLELAGSRYRFKQGDVPLGS